MTKSSHGTLPEHIHQLPFQTARTIAGFDRHTCAFQKLHTPNTRPTCLLTTGRRVCVSQVQCLLETACQVLHWDAYSERSSLQIVCHAVCDTLCQQLRNKKVSFGYCGFVCIQTQSRFTIRMYLLHRALGRVRSSLGRPPAKGKSLCIAFAYDTWCFRVRCEGEARSLSLSLCRVPAASATSCLVSVGLMDNQIVCTMLQPDQHVDFVCKTLFAVFVWAHLVKRVCNFLSNFRWPHG